MVSEAVRVPAAVGLKPTETVQFEPGNRLELQVLISPKSGALVPVMTTWLTLRGTGPVFVTVTMRAWLLVPINWSAKFRLAGDSETVGSCRRIETTSPDLSVMATSGLPLSSKSPTASPPGFEPPANVSGD